MKIFELLKHPLLKWPGIILILYFGLFHDKRNPSSLGNRLSRDNVKKNLSEAIDKTKFIAANVHEAQEVLKQKEAAETQSGPKPEVSVDDNEIGSGEEVVSCSDNVEISYAIYDQNGKQLEFFPLEKFRVGTKYNQIIEKNIIGMKKDGIRNIKVPQGFKTDDKKLSELFSFNEGDLKYQITLLSFSKSSKENSHTKLICN
jgi:hypothetical protein